MNDNTTRPFGVVLRDLLIARGIVTTIGNPHWTDFVLRLDGIHYETLRKAVTGERSPADKLIVAVSTALGILPETFAEYRLAQARRQLDPAAVTLPQALDTLAAWETFLATEVASEQAEGRGTGRKRPT